MYQILNRISLRSYHKDLSLFCIPFFFHKKGNYCSVYPYDIEWIYNIDNKNKRSYLFFVLLNEFRYFFIVGIIGNAMKAKEVNPHTQMNRTNISLIEFLLQNE